MMNIEQNENVNTIKIKKEITTAPENDKVVDPMDFMTPEQIAEEDAKAEAFFKALRFGTSNFFRKLKEVYEVEGINGLNRIERSLDAYFMIRNIVAEEIMIANPEQVCSECENELQQDRANLIQFTPNADAADGQNESVNADSENTDQWEEPAEADFDTDETEENSIADAEPTEELTNGDPTANYDHE